MTQGVPGVVNPLDNEDQFDTIILAGLNSPGVVTLSGHDREIDWDVKTGPGTTGGTTTLKAQKLVEFTAAFYLADADDWNEWPAFQTVVESSVKGKGAGLDVYHPDLARNGINTVVMKKIGGVVHDKKGGQTITVTFLEYRPPKPAVVSPASAKAKTENDPDAAAKAELTALTAQYATTPWGADTRTDGQKVADIQKYQADPTSFTNGVPTPPKT